MKSTDFKEALLKLPNTIITGKEAFYISTPITTGIRFLEWFKREGRYLNRNSDEYKLKHDLFVVQPNIDDGSKTINRLRNKLGKIIIDPISFEANSWSQDEFNLFWRDIIHTYVDTVIFLEGWQYSNGCCLEFLAAVKFNVKLKRADLLPLPVQEGRILIEDAIDEFNKLSIPALTMEQVLVQLNELKESPKPKIISATNQEQLEDLHFKDAHLNTMAMTSNIAQFVSYGPGLNPKQRYCWIKGVQPNKVFKEMGEAIELLLNNSQEKTVNVRSFLPNQPKGNPFKYGMDDAKEVINLVKDNASKGLYSIVNETISINDGGVSGVVIGNVIEFTPNDTPKGVDKPGICSLPKDIGFNLLRIVYGISPELNFGSEYRVEFSIHPMRRGIQNQQTIIWEIEKVENLEFDFIISWPNNFSEFLGDKAFGLLIADALGLPVPKTTFIGRNVAPFTFGTRTGTNEIWIRTCPKRRTPGKYSTFFGWKDPFEILASEDHHKNNYRISSVLSQESVNPVYSGSLIPTVDKTPYIEGVKGKGDDFMTGKMAPTKLPDYVVKSVENLYEKTHNILGNIELEWVHDGEMAWIVQLHRSKFIAQKGVIYEGTATEYLEFQVKDGLEELRKLISDIKGTDIGVILVGDVGITSHFGDLLRRAKISSFVRNDNN